MSTSTSIPRDHERDRDHAYKQGQGQGQVVPILASLGLEGGNAIDACLDDDL